MPTVRLSHPDQRTARRRDRYELRDHLARLSSLPRVRGCGRRRIDSTRDVQVRYSDERGAGYGNLQHCGSVWSCPVCSAKIRNERAVEIEGALARHLARGGGAYFVTLTVPHDQGDKLAQLWDAVAGSWRAVTTGSRWRRLSRESGLDLGGRHRRFGVIRSLEVTYGDFGWHPHLHVLILTASPLPSWSLEQLTAHLTERWAAEVTSRGLRRPSDDHGVTVSAVSTATDVANYLVKVQDDDVARGVGNELARHDLKLGRRKGRTPFQLLDDYARQGDAQAGAVWFVWERESKGRQAITWSPGLKQALAVEEVDDQQLADGAAEDPVLFTIPAYAWTALQRCWGGRQTLLEAVEDARGDPGQALDYLARVVADPSG